MGGLGTGDLATVCVMPDGLVAGEVQAIRLERYGSQQVGELIQADPLVLLASTLALRARLVAYVGFVTTGNLQKERSVTQLPLIKQAKIPDSSPKMELFLLPQRHSGRANLSQRRVMV